MYLSRCIMLMLLPLPRGGVQHHERGPKPPGWRSGQRLQRRARRAGRLRAAARDRLRAAARDRRPRRGASSPVGAVCHLRKSALLAER